MSSLFEGFDLGTSISNSTTTAPQVKQQSKKPQAADNLTNQNLFGDELKEYNIELNKPKVNTLLEKLSSTDVAETDAKKILKSKKITLEEKLNIIKNKVLEVLGKQRKMLLLLRLKKTLKIMFLNVLNLVV